jgi:hypothetical protein
VVWVLASVEPSSHRTVSGPSQPTSSATPLLQFRPVPTAVTAVPGGPDLGERARVGPSSTARAGTKPTAMSKNGTNAAATAAGCAEPLASWGPMRTRPEFRDRLNSQAGPRQNQPPVICNTTARGMESCRLTASDVCGLSSNRAVRCRRDTAAWTLSVVNFGRRDVDQTSQARSGWVSFPSGRLIPTSHWSLPDGSNSAEHRGWCRSWLLGSGCRSTDRMCGPATRRPDRGGYGLRRSDGRIHGGANLSDATLTYAKMIDANVLGCSAVQIVYSRRRGSRAGSRLLRRSCRHAGGGSGTYAVNLSGTDTYSEHRRTGVRLG